MGNSRYSAAHHVLKNAMAILGQDIGPSLIKALGLPKQTVWFELRCAVNEIVTVKCEYWPEGDPFAISAVLAEYELVQRENVPVDAIGFDAWLRARTNAAHDTMMQRHSGLSRMDARLFCGGYK